MTGITTGVYDLFHAGHENLIRVCAGKCDILLIAVASDWLTKVQKGKDRPIENEAKRLKNVKDFINEHGYNCIAFITDKLNFNDLEMVDVFFVGPDQVNIRWNGPRIEIPRTPGISTGQIIKERGLL